MSKKFFLRFFGACIFVGLMMVLASAGASDLGSLEFKRIVVNALIGLGLMFVGYAGLKVGGSKYVM